MAIDKISGRQEVIAARAPFSYADFDNPGTEVETAIRIPYDAVIVYGYLAVTTAFSGTATIDIGDTDNNTRYGSGIDVTSTGLTEFTVDGVYYDGPNYVTVGTNESLTAGEAELVVQYIIKGRAAFSAD